MLPALSKCIVDSTCSTLPSFAKSFPVPPGLSTDNSKWLFCMQTSTSTRSRPRQLFNLLLLAVNWLVTPEYKVNFMGVTWILMGFYYVQRRYKLSVLHFTRHREPEWLVHCSLRVERPRSDRFLFCWCWFVFTPRTTHSSSALWPHKAEIRQALRVVPGRFVETRQITTDVSAFHIGHKHTKTTAEKFRRTRVAVA